MVLNENLIDDLNPSLSDIESDNESDNESHHRFGSESDKESSN